MPLSKYYCDYCDKQFQDTPGARKRHLSGIQHQRAKALWYDSVKDPYRIQTDGFGKGVCNRFVRTNDHAWIPCEGDQTSSSKAHKMMKDAKFDILTWELCDILDHL
ncbi:hypothetical protein ACLOJK_021938 [Asimina triloba]